METDRKGSSAAAGEYVLSAFSDADGELLLRSAAGASGWSYGAEATQVMKLCEQLPLALAVVAGGIQTGGPHSSWADVLQALVVPTDGTAADRALGFNLSTAGSGARQLYLELSIFPEDVWIPQALLEVYCTGAFPYNP